MICRKNIAVVTWTLWVTSFRVTSCEEKSEVSSGQTGVELFDGCKWTVVGGGVIDLSSIGRKDSTPRFPDVQANDEYLYSYNPCYPFDEGTCSQAAVCQTTQAKDVYYQAGDATGAELTTDDQGRPSIHYSADSPDTLRNSYVSLICDQSASEPSLRALGDLSFAEYHFELTTVCACPDGCGGGGGDITVTVELSISIGSILCISFLAIVVVYLVVGAVYNKARHQRSGSELVPNLNLWKTLPGLVKDGFVYTGSKICRRKRSEYEKM